MEQIELLRRVIDILEKLEITYFVVGSLASGVYGEPRFTQDIDIVLELSSDKLLMLCGEFPVPEFYVSISAAREALATQGQFNVIHPTSGQKIDFMIVRDDDWGRTQVERRRQKDILGRQGFMAAPEDIILAKLWYYQDGGSEKHLRDIAAMLQVSGKLIDTENIEQWSERLGFSKEWSLVVERLKGI